MLLRILHQISIIEASVRRSDHNGIILPVNAVVLQPCRQKTRHSSRFEFLRIQYTITFSIYSWRTRWYSCQQTVTYCRAMYLSFYRMPTTWGLELTLHDSNRTYVNISGIRRICTHGVYSTWLRILFPVPSFGSIAPCRAQVKLIMIKFGENLSTKLNILQL